MRIDSGLSSNYSYQNRYVPSTADTDDAAPDTSTISKARTGSPNTFSSTLLSNQLASALWTVEGGRKASLTTESATANSDERVSNSVSQQVEAAYREYDLPDYAEF
ncbi:hypothetical protein PDO_2344 [Rhizobium sp. PDO1-076]|uniref:hypothetical protein n=1 Tax=Rhizobium sp. PDO1-076 TaxID=1125979 RepID=UPI00024E3CFE|nr:hypothetical protein [Rhizobium sp. PDO1-076]EHS50614.1 hypothetical protein PDO_2344 [Rhizobium sp. PDO1-076]